MLNVNDVTRLYLGVQGENEAQTITIDVAPWLVAHPGGSVTIWHKRNGDEVPAPTGAVFDDEAGTVSWTPTSTDTYVSGEGEAEIRLTEGTVIKKSRAVKTGVSPAVTGAGVPLGSDWQSYIDAVDTIRSAAVTAKQAAEAAASDSEAYAIGERGGEPVESDDPTYQNNSKYYEGLAAQYAAEAENARDDILNMSVSAEQLPEGSSPTVAYAEGHMAFGIPKGDHAFIVTESEKYQESVSGTVIPTGTWLDERPDLTQGKFLWIKRTRVWNGGTTTNSYEAYYTAVDGEGSTLVIDDQPTQGSQGVPKSGGTYTMIQTKAAKVANATSGNFAALDENGDLIDSGHKHSDYLTQHQDITGKKDKQTPVTDPTASGTAAEFIAGITQDAQGVIVPSKKTVRTMSGATAAAAGATGLVPAPAAGDQEKVLKGDGTWGDAGSVLTPTQAISIPGANESVTYNMAGITADYELIRWNFSASPENNPPTSLSWTTGSGTFTITNNGAATLETIKPVFTKTVEVSATAAV